jgi:hypothetical protein
MRCTGKDIGQLSREIVLYGFLTGRNALFLQVVRRIFDSFTTSVQNMSIDHGASHVVVAQELPNVQIS